MTMSPPAIRNSTAASGVGVLDVIAPISISSGKNRALEAEVGTQQVHRRRRQIGGALRVESRIEEMAQKHEVGSVRDRGPKWR